GPAAAGGRVLARAVARPAGVGALFRRLAGRRRVVGERAGVDVGFGEQVVRRGILDAIRARMPGDRAVELRAQRLEVADLSVVGIHRVDAVLAGEGPRRAGHRKERRLRAPAHLRTGAGPVLLSIRRAEGADARDAFGALRE